MADPPTLLLVGGSRAVPISIALAIEALAQAHARGLRTHLTSKADMLAATRPVAAAANAVSAVDFSRPGQTARWALWRAAAGERFDAVFAVQEAAQVAAAETAEALGLRGNPPEAMRLIRIKDACRAKLAAAGFAQPAVRLCAGDADAGAFLRRAVGPCIVKPRDAMGSAGVSQVHDPSDLPAALALLPGTGPFLIEEFVEGPEFSVEGVVLGGMPHILAVTAKEKVPPPYFAEVGHVLPAELPDARRREIERQVASALITLGLRTGPFHVELWLTPGGIVLGEVHARFGGGWIHRMLEYIIPGLKVFGLVYDDLLGRANGHRRLEPVRGAAVRYLCPPPGRVLRISGWQDVLRHPAVLHAELTVAEGGVVRPLRQSADRVGLVAVGARTPGEARELARNLAESVHFEIGSADPAAGKPLAGANR